MGAATHPVADGGLQRHRSFRCRALPVLQRVVLRVLLVLSAFLLTTWRTTPFCCRAHGAHCGLAPGGDASGTGKGLRALLPALPFRQPAALLRCAGFAVVVAATRADNDVSRLGTLFDFGDLAAVGVSASALSSMVGQHAGGSGSEAAKAPKTTGSSSSSSLELSSLSSESSPMESSSFSSAGGSAVVLVDDSVAIAAPPLSLAAPAPDNLGTRRSPTKRLALLGLIALAVPAIIIALIVWCICRRTRYRHRMKELRLNGTRCPGEVDDVDMGNAVMGGDWLSLDAVATGRTRIGANRSCFLISAPSTAAGICVDGIFDPIGQQAVEARQRKRARRVAVAAAEAAGSPTNRVGNSSSGGLADSFGDVSGAVESEMWSSDEEGRANVYSLSGGTGGDVGGAGGSAPIYATSLVLPGAGATGAGASLGAGPSLHGGATASSAITVVPPLARNSQYFNDTARVLLGRYRAKNESGGQQMPPLALPDGGGAATQSLQPAAGTEVGSSNAVLSKSYSAFEQILSSTVAPLQVGREFHQRGDSADSVERPKGLAAPVPRDGDRAERHAENEDIEGEEGEEEEHAFQDVEGLGNEYKNEEYEDDDDGSPQGHSSGSYVPGAQSATRPAPRRSLR
nr:unnamed protein product [Leishmania braziliensis]